MRFKMMLVVLLLAMVVLPAAAQEDTITYSDDVITFEYPEDWFQCECDDTENIVAVGNTEDAPSTDDLDDDEVQVAIFKSVAVFLDENVGVEFDADTPEDALVNHFGGDDVDTHEFDDREAASMTTENDDLEALFIVVDLNNGEMAMIIATARPGTLEDFEDDVFDIAETVVATEDADVDEGEDEDEDEGEALELTENFELENGDFALEYPEDWQAFEDAGSIILINDEAILELEDVADLDDDQLLLFIYPTVEGLPDYDFPVDDGTVPSTIVSFYASMGFATGIQQVGAMEEPEIGDGELEASSTFGIGEDFERLVIAIENGDGDIITTIALAAPDNMEQFRPTIEAIIASFEVE